VPSLFFVMHSLRFTDLQSGFVQEIISATTIWAVHSESDLEIALREAMPKVMAAIDLVWMIFFSSKTSPDRRFVIERQLCPKRGLQFLGCYTNGPKSWSWSAFPFKDLGMRLHLVALNPAVYDQDVAFGKLVNSFRGLCVAIYGEDEESHRIGIYMITHMLRSWMDSSGRASSINGWFGGNAMSSTNKLMWRKLGMPSTKEFAALCHLPHEAIQCGFHLCFTGEVISHYLKGDKWVDTAALQNLCQFLDTHDWIPLVEKSLANTLRADSMEWSAAVWFSPLMMLQCSQGAFAPAVESAADGIDCILDSCGPGDEQLPVDDRMGGGVVVEVRRSNCRAVKRKGVPDACPVVAKCAVLDSASSDAAFLDRSQMPFHWPANMTEKQIYDIGFLRQTVKNEKSALYRFTVLKPFARGAHEKVAVCRETLAMTIAQAWKMHDILSISASQRATHDIDDGLAMIAAGIAKANAGRGQLEYVQWSGSAGQGALGGPVSAKSAEATKLINVNYPALVAWAKERGIKARSKKSLVAKIAEEGMTIEAITGVVN
jgi:hypothetical protein